MEDRQLENLKLRLELIGVNIQLHQLSISLLSYKSQEVQAQIKALEESAATPVGTEDA